MNAKRATGILHTESAMYCDVFSYRSAGDCVKFEGSECNENDDCTLSVGTSVSVADTWTVNGGLSIKVPGPAKGIEAAFNAGAPYAHTDTRTYTTTVTHSKKDEPYAKGHSGFWAHAPDYITQGLQITLPLESPMEKPHADNSLRGPVARFRSGSQKV